MKRVFVFNPDKCCACSACMMGCMDQNDIDLAAGGSCYRKTFDQEIEERLPVRCLHALYGRSLHRRLSGRMPGQGSGNRFYCL